MRKRGKKDSKAAKQAALEIEMAKSLMAGLSEGARVAAQASDFRRVQRLLPDPEVWGMIAAHCPECANKPVWLRRFPRWGTITVDRDLLVRVCLACGLCWLHADLELEEEVGTGLLKAMAGEQETYDLKGALTRSVSSLRLFSPIIGDPQDWFFTDEEYEALFRAVEVIERLKDKRGKET